jgi:uncharacterized protein YcbK (DUF882 family)
MLRDINYFTDEEFECPCCHRQLIDQRMVSMLDSVRKAIGRPINITSGYRCLLHNMYLMASSTSSHRKGLAVDIACTMPGYRYILLRALIAVGFVRIGIGPNFIHVDVDPGKLQDRIWTY